MTHLGDDDLQSYLDGMDGPDRDRAERHLSECAACRDQLAVLRFVGESLSPPPAETFSAGFEGETMRAVGRVAASRWGPGDLGVAAVGVATAALMLLILLLSGDPWAFTRQSLEQVESWMSAWSGTRPGSGEWLPAIAGASLALLLFGNLDRLCRRFVVSTRRGPR
jgi:hypothetical protein